MSDAPLTIPKLREVEYLEVQDRRPLSKWEFATLFLAQEGKCRRCGCRLEKGKVRDEHLHALHLGGGNELSNRALWCLACTKPKDATDKAAIAKGKRIRGETCTGPRRKISSRSTFSDLPKPQGIAGRGLRSRGFDKSKSRGFNGKVRDRV